MGIECKIDDLYEFLLHCIYCFFFLRFAFCFCLQDIKEHHGKTAVDLARENGNKRIVEFITNFKPQLKCELFTRVLAI